MYHQTVRHLTRRMERIEKETVPHVQDDDHYGRAVVELSAEVKNCVDEILWKMRQRAER